MFGWSRNEAVGRPLVDLIIPEQGRSDFFRELSRLSDRAEQAAEPGSRTELTGVRRSGEQFPLEMSLGSAASGDERLICAFMTDISQRKQLELALKHQATHDKLTGLPNRAELSQRLEWALARKDRTREGLAVFFLDLDRFKSINDTHGHEAGDAVLVEFAQRLQNAVRRTDTVARLAGDEFVIVLVGMDDAEAGARAVAGKIIAQMDQPFSVAGADIRISTSIGIAIVDHQEFCPEALLSRADEAMYRAKKSGRNRYQFHSDAGSGERCPPESE